MLEVKRTLDGARREFRCRVLTRSAGHVVLLYVSPKEAAVHGLRLPKATLTFGYFWEDRPFNVYHWLHPAGRTIAFYFNLAAETHLSDDQLEWLDLVVDVMATPDGRVVVLDEDELNEFKGLALEQRNAILDARAAVLAAQPAVCAELELRSRALYEKHDLATIDSHQQSG